MSDILKAEEFEGMVDANTPLFNRPAGWLKTLQNMRVKPGGWLEARGGYETLKHSGGTGAGVGSTGQFGGFHEHVRQQGAVFMADAAISAANYSCDIGMLYYFPLFHNGATDFTVKTPVIGVGNLNSCIYFGSEEPFSWLRFNHTGTGGGSTYLVTWEYWNGTIWTALTTSPANPDFKTGGILAVGWVPPSTWVPFSVNNYFMYWVRVRISTAGVATTPTICQEKIRSDWVGRRILIAGMVGNAWGAGAGSVLFLHGETTAGVTAWTQSVGLGAAQVQDRTRVRMVTYQDRLIATDGSRCVKFTMNQSAASGGGEVDLGFKPPDLVGGAVVVAIGGGAFGQAGKFSYGISYGWGPNGEWGESEVIGPTIPQAFTAVQSATLTWAFVSVQPPGMVDVIYVYRTNDLTGMAPNSYLEQPMYRIATLPRAVTGITVPLPLTYADANWAIPFPAKSAIQAPNMPPFRFRLLAVLKNFLFIGGSVEFPSRVYWSDGSYGEAFDLDITTSNRFADFAWAGPEVVMMSPAFDSMWCWTEDRMFGVSSPEEDFPDVFEHETGRGCTAPESVCSGFGYLLWQSKDGIYAMDQNRVVTRITNDTSAIFGNMPKITHGGSRAIIQNGMYEIQLAAPDGTPVAGDSRWRFDLVKPSWSKSSLALAPLALVQAPLGHADQGVLHPIYGNINPAVSDRVAYVGEYTTTDAAVGFDCIADIHFGPGKFQKFSPRRFAGYYQADSGWGTPVISTVGNYIFKTVAGFGTVTPKSGSDYKLAIANCTERVTGSQDIVIRFKATTVGGGAVRGQRLIAAYLDGRMVQVSPTS